MTLIYPNPIWIPSVKRRKVDADFSACAISGYKIKSSSDGMNCASLPAPPSTPLYHLTALTLYDPTVPSKRSVRTKSTLVATY